MSTTTEATEGQAKIREALERMLHVGGKLKTSLEKVYEFNTKADRSGAEFNRKEWDALEYVAHEALAALDASPPIVGELTEEEIKRIAEHESEFAQHFADGLRYARDHGYLAQAPQSSPAAQGVMVDQILEVVNDWRANMHLIEVPPNTPYSTGVQNVLRSRLSALLTNPK